MKFHPLAECLPMLPGHELSELANDIRKNGLRIPVTVFEEKILDGRNRYAACKQAKIKVRYEPYEGDDPVGFILSHNINRRHIPPGKRATYALRIFAAGEVWASAGRPKKDSKTATVDAVAAAAGVSKATVKRVKRAQKKDAAPQQEPKIKGSNDPFFDALGFPIPELALPYWNRANEVKEVLKEISKLKSWADHLHSRKDPMYCEVNLGFIRAELGNIHQNIKGALPYVVCTLCDGLNPDDCVLCHGRGVISEFRWEHALPNEDREKRQRQIEQLSQSNTA